MPQEPRLVEPFDQLPGPCAIWRPSNQVDARTTLLPGRKSGLPRRHPNHRIGRRDPMYIFFEPACDGARRAFKSDDVHRPVERDVSGTRHERVERLQAVASGLNQRGAAGFQPSLRRSKCRSGWRCLTRACRKSAAVTPSGSVKCAASRCTCGHRNHHFRQIAPIAPSLTLVAATGLLNIMTSPHLPYFG